MSNTPNSNPTSDQTPGADQHPDGAALYRHQDGGIYRFVGMASHTTDLADLVIYEHIWPFALGVKWARPAAEWASRFKPISQQEMLQALQEDRITAQHVIIQAKAARRARASNQ